MAKRPYFRKILVWFSIALSATIGGVLILDNFAGRCSAEPQIKESIKSVSSINLWGHVRELSAIGSRFHRVKKGPGIKKSDRYPKEWQTINQNLEPLGFAISTGQEREQKLAYIEKQMTRIGLSPQRMTFETKKVGTGINLYGEIRGKKYPKEILDVTAHYDSYADSPGADDNHSGVAGVLEIAKIIGKTKNMDRTVRFVFFDLEELGLIGSHAFVNAIESGTIARPMACLNLEMIGYFSDESDTQQTPIRIPLLFDPPTVGNTIMTVGNFRSYRYGRKLDGVFLAYVPELPVFSVSRWGDLLANAARSDHSSYWKANIPAVMLTDTANFRNPNYHQPSDQPETLDFQRMKLVTQGAAAFVLQWATE